MEIGIGTMLRDMGKKSVPQKILSKPGKLNQEEWELMKKTSGIRYGSFF